MTGPDRLAPPPPAAGDADGRAGGCAGEPFATVTETHSAVVFFAGDRAYKLKKPVNLGFVDFSTPEARVAACQREAEPNRRFAPDVYLGVMKVFDSARMARVTMLRGAIARLEALEHEFLFFVEPVPAAAASSTTATTATTASSSRPMCRNEPPASQPA